MLYLFDMPKRKNKQKPPLIVLFGATGDLSRKKIFPALSSLYDKGELPHNSRVIGISRRPWNTHEFHDFLKLKSNVSSSFLHILEYAGVDFEIGIGYDDLSKQVSLLAKNREVIVYLSLAPHHFTQVVKSLRKSKILRKGKVKLLLEKPFGVDEKSACTLNRFLLSFLSHSQIYRIDHYLGKTSVQAMMRVHESSTSLRQIISNKTVESVTISLLEAKGIDGRGLSYDSVGAFRDVGQNHILEILASLLAEYPHRVSANSWHDARAAVLEALLPPSKTCELARRGQYEGYEHEKGVAHKSETETAFEVITGFSRGELLGIPVIFQAGKMMGETRSLVRIIFKESSGLPREIEFSIQPKPRVIIRMKDGAEEVLELSSQEAYENILIDVLRGERRHFVGSREIQAAWRYSDRVVSCWNKVPLERYSQSHPFFPL